MAHRKRFQDLDLRNAFLFAAALEEPDICRLVLELILEEPIRAVKVKAERTILFRSDCRSIRLDIYASDEFAVGYNLEMQNEDEGNLPKRSRYHQAEMDVSSLKPGQDFQELQPSIIVFICTFDPFGKKAYRYTFEQSCIEYGFPLGDETKRIFLNTKGENEKEVPEELVHFLRYVENSTDDYVNQIGDSKLAQIHAKVKALKRSRELEERYMQFEEMLEKEHTLGFEQGKIVERKRMLSLISLMVFNGEKELVPLLSEDEEFCKEMLEKYNL